MTRQMTVALALAFALAFALALPATPRAVPAPPGVSLAAFPSPAPPIAVTCTFSNHSYAGDCVEKTTRTEKDKPETACRPILDCLNNPRCAKSYCQATTIRQGWTLKKAE